MKKNKITLIGAGLVGSSFLHAAINLRVGSEYVIIDLDNNLAEGQALDLDDASALSRNFAKVRAGNYSDLDNTNILVICAGRPQKPGESRLNMVVDNSKIMKSIALNVKKTKFKGMTVIASNPVDVLTYVYLKTTNFSSKKVFSSGTYLDSKRLEIVLAEKTNKKLETINGYVFGEHGDSSFFVPSISSIGNDPIEKHIKTHQAIAGIEKIVSGKAYSIIDKKRVSHFGIGTSLAVICNCLSKSSESRITLGVYQNNEYENINDVILGVEVVVNNTGLRRIVKHKLTAKEMRKLSESSEIVGNLSRSVIKKI